MPQSSGSAADKDQAYASNVQATVKARARKFNRSSPGETKVPKCHQHDFEVKLDVNGDLAKHGRSKIRQSALFEHGKPEETFSLLANPSDLSSTQQTYEPPRSSLSKIDQCLSLHDRDLPLSTASNPLQLSISAREPYNSPPRSPLYDFSRLDDSIASHLRPKLLPDSRQGATTTIRETLGSPEHHRAALYHARELNSQIRKADKFEEPAGMPVVFCSFDTLDRSGCNPPALTTDILILGYDDGLDVYQVSREGSKLIASVKQLEGKTRSAKIIPWAFHHDPLSAERPLVAIVRLAPCLDEPREEKRGTGKPTFWQAYVEIYSLNSSERVSVIYASEPVALTTYEPNAFGPPEPSEPLLQLETSGQFLTVTSAKSGEIFIFATTTGRTQNTAESFHCVGKVWTSVHRPFPRPPSRSTGPEDGASNTESCSNQGNVPLLALSNRWLAFMPPSAPNLSSVGGTPLRAKGDFTVPGLQSLSAPLPPPVTCSVELPEDDALINRMARGVAQEVLKGARWVGVHGVQAWKSYWNQDSSTTNATIYRRIDPLGQQSQSSFPPTHGHVHSLSADSSGAGNLAIIDLQVLLRAEAGRNPKAVEPFATFPIALGCSFLSFSPDGLNLLTVSYKGDEQNIWDLMGLYRTAIPSKYPSNTAHSKLKPQKFQSCIRKVVKHARYTDAKVVDIVWSVTGGQRVALLTERGTLHLFNIDRDAHQSSATSRRTYSAGVNMDSEDELRTDDDTLALRSYNGLWNTALQTPLLLAGQARRLSSGSMPALTASPPSTSVLTAKSGKAIAAGFNRSYEAASDSINLLRHLGDNKLRLEKNRSRIEPGSVMFLSGQDDGFIATTSGESVRIHAVRAVATGQSRERRLSISKESRVEHKLTTRQYPHPLRFDREVEVPKSQGFWRPLVETSSSVDKDEDVLHSLSLAELDACASNRSFQTNAKRHLYMIKETAYTDGDPGSDPQRRYDPNCWAFGTLSTLQLVEVNAGVSDNTYENKTLPPDSEEVQPTPSKMPMYIKPPWIGNSRAKNTAVSAATQSDTPFEDCEILEYAE